MFLLLIPKMLSVLQIVQVGLMLVGLLLETDMEIGFLPVSVFEEQDAPLDDVPDEEREIQQFSLLRSMNEFVVQFGGGQGTKGEDDAKQTYGIVVLGQWEVLHQVYALHLSNR